MKVFLTNKRLLNEEILKEEFYIVENQDEADYIFAVDSVLDIKEKNYPKTILFQKESPLTAHRRWTYSNFDKFKYVFCHNPNGKNQFPFSDNPLFFPFYECFTRFIVSPLESLLTDRQTHLSIARL